MIWLKSADIERTYILIKYYLETKLYLINVNDNFVKSNFNKYTYQISNETPISFEKPQQSILKTLEMYECLKDIQISYLSPIIDKEKKYCYAIYCLKYVCKVQTDII